MEENFESNGPSQVVSQPQQEEMASDFNEERGPSGNYPKSFEDKVYSVETDARRLGSEETLDNLKNIINFAERAAFILERKQDLQEIDELVRGVNPIRGTTIA